MTSERGREHAPSIIECIEIQRHQGLLSISLGREDVHIGYIKKNAHIRPTESSKPIWDELALSGQRVDVRSGVLIFSGNVQTASLERSFKMSPDSDAKYLARLQTDRFLFLYQYLEGQTSRHMHPGEGELFIAQEIENPSLVHNSTIEIISDRLYLPPDTYHEAFSFNQPTLTAIVQSATVEHKHDPDGKTPRSTLCQKLEYIARTG